MSVGVEPSIEEDDLPGEVAVVQDSDHQVGHLVRSSKPSHRHARAAVRHRQ